MASHNPQGCAVPIWCCQLSLAWLLFPTFRLLVLGKAISARSQVGHGTREAQPDIQPQHHPWSKTQNLGVGFHYPESGDSPILA